MNKIVAQDDPMHVRMFPTPSAEPDADRRASQFYGLLEALRTRRQWSLELQAEIENYALNIRSLLSASDDPQSNVNFAELKRAEYLLIELRHPEWYDADHETPD